MVLRYTCPLAAVMEVVDGVEKILDCLLTNIVFFVDDGILFDDTCSVGIYDMCVVYGTTTCSIAARQRFSWSF